MENDKFLVELTSGFFSCFLPSCFGGRKIWSKESIEKNDISHESKRLMVNAVINGHKLDVLFLGGACCQGGTSNYMLMNAKGIFGA